MSTWEIQIWTASLWSWKLWNKVPFNHKRNKEFSGLVKKLHQYRRSSHLLQWAHSQIYPILATRSWALQDKETHLSNNRSVVIRLESQYRSRTINMRGELELSRLLRQRCWPFTPAVSVSPAADTKANADRQEEENVRKIKYTYQWETWGDKVQGEDRFSLLPEEERPDSKPENGFWRFPLWLVTSTCPTFRQSV